MKKNILLIGNFILLSASFSFAQPGAALYRIAHKFPVEGEGGWDYLAVDDSLGRLYVSHGSAVNILDSKTGRTMGIIPDTKGVHGIAIARDLNKGFISNGKDESVTVFDLTTNGTITKITIPGKNPDAILYDPFSHSVFTFNGGSHNATVINPLTNEVIATIELDGKPEFAVSNGKGKVYVNIEDKSLVCVIDIKTLKVEQRWPVAPGVEPSGLAMDIKNNRLFSVCDNKLMVIMDALTGKVIASLPIGARVDGVVYDPWSKRALSSNGEGTMTVVQENTPDNFEVIDNFNTQKSARTITFDPRTHHIYMPAAEFDPAPAPSPANPKPRPVMKTGSFVILDIQPL